MAVSTKVYATATMEAFGGTTVGESPNIDWLSDDIYIALVKSTYMPDQSADKFWSSVVGDEVANGNGYATNGKLLIGKTLTVAALVATFVAANPAAWTASGAGFAAAYAVIYDRTPATDATRPLICYIDFDGTRTLAAGDTLTITFNASGIFTVTVS
jgi:hypothetical protein